MTDMATGAPGPAAPRPTHARPGETARDATNAVFPGDTEMARRCRAFDWAATPLGPVDAWPQSLRTAAGMVIGSAFANIVCWGPALVQIYNDGYIPITGVKHPEALGRPTAEVWPEVWHLNRPLFARAQAGETVHIVEAPYALRRRGPNHPADDTFFTLSFSPVLDETGAVGGVLVTAFEITQEVETRRLQDERARLLAALQVERARLEDVIRVAPAFMAVLRGPDHVIELTNSGYDALVGGREVLGRSVAEALPEAAAQGFITLLDGVLATGEPFVGREVPYRRPDAAHVEDERYVDFVYQALTEADGTRSGILVHGVDVTDQVRARREVERSLAASETTRAALELANAQLQDQQVELELATEHAQENAAEFEMQAEELQATAAHLEERTEAAERALAAFAESEARFRTVEDASPDAVLLLRPIRARDGEPAAGEHPDGTIVDFEITYANAPAGDMLGGGTADALVGGRILTLFPNTAPEGYFAAYARAFETGVPYAREDRYTHDGLDLSVRVTAVRAGDVLHVRVEDIAERLQAEDERARLLAEAERANRSKGEFLATMSHELRTPLNAIGGYVELVELGIHGPVTVAQRTALERIQRSQRHLLGLINGVLNYARVEAGAVYYGVEDVPLAEVLVTCEALVAPQARAKGLTLALVTRDAVPRVRADREKVQQVVLNLLSNAVKFTAPGGSVTLSYAADGGVVHVRVTDTGIGIAPEELERVFEPFVQVDARLTRTQEGTGLGLAISRDLARGMGGDLTAESAPGAGSTFTLTLPSA